jgi:4-hydroxy-tetrahydrodipicolinate reductase
MGATVCRAVEAAPDMELVARADPALATTLEDALSAAPDVLVDFTIPATALANARQAVGAGVHVVIGTTGFDVGELEDLRGAKANVFVAPNFAIGAVLMMQFAAEAARHMAKAEIIELHHDGKVDAPSGTALSTAERLAKARRDDWQGPDGENVAGVRGGETDGVRIHSVRLPGLVAHQEIIFGGPGQTLTIRHDSMDRESFMPGVLLAVKQVATRKGLTVGLEPLLDLPPLPEGDG